MTIRTRWWSWCSSARQSAVDSRYAVMCGGGTALGALQVPVLHRLQQEKGMPIAYSGTSIGANNVSMAGRGPEGLRELRRVWRRVDGTGFFQRPRPDVWNGLYTLRPLRRVHDDMRSCEDLQTKVYVCMYDLGEAKHRTVCLNDIESIDARRDAVISSSQQPVIHHHARFDGRWNADGGVASVLGRLPSGILDQLDELHVISCGPVHWRQRRKRRPQKDVAQAWEQLQVCLEAWMTIVTERDLRWLREVAREMPVYLYAPTSWDQVGQAFDASPAVIAKRLAFGRQVQSVRVQPSNGWSQEQVDRALAFLDSQGVDTRDLLRRI